MEYYISDDGQQEEQKMHEDTYDSSEEAFMRGYNDEGNVHECAECGGAIDDEHAVSKEVEGEKVTFCSKTCAEDYMESVGN